MKKVRLYCDCLCVCGGVGVGVLEIETEDNLSSFASWRCTLIIVSGAAKDIGDDREALWEMKT